MRAARRAFLASTLASLAAPAIIRLAWADAPQFTFKLHHSFSSVSSGHDKFLAPWARKVEADSGGRIRIDLFPSMQLGGAPALLFDQVRDGLADIAWAMPSLTPGRFPKIESFELPFVPSRRALVSSKALDDFAAANLKDEFREVHPICFSCTDRGVVHGNRPVRTVEDINGLRLHVQTRFTGAAIQALGARAVPMPSAQLPLAITQHVIDGCVDPWDMVPGLKLHDLLKTHTDFADSSLSTTTLVLAMNKTAYDRLPAELKKVIDGNSGQVAAGAAGAMWDVQAAAVSDMVVQRGDPIITLLPEAVAHWRKATEPVIDAWLKDMKEHKVDGGKLLASAHAMLAKYADEPEPQPPQAAQPPEQKVVTQPGQAPQAKAVATKPDVTATPKADAPSPAPAMPVVKPAPAPTPTASVTAPAPSPAPATPVVKPAPVPTPAVSVATPPPPPTPAPATASAAPVAKPAAAAVQAAPVPTPAPMPAPAIVKPAPAAVLPPKTLDIPL
jgi:TRAP-type C4-dicarboxylate transport system substrate-binding protein